MDNTTSKINMTRSHRSSHKGTRSNPALWWDSQQTNMKISVLEHIMYGNNS